MKKNIMAVLVSIMLVLSLIGIVEAELTKDESNVKPFVDAAFKAREQLLTPDIFEAEVTKELITRMKSNDPTELIVGASYYAFMQVYMDDRISCARTQYEVDELTNKKAAISLPGEGIMEKIKNLPPAKGSTEARKNAALDKIFNQILPSVKKLYREHPDRKFCGSR